MEEQSIRRRKCILAATQYQLDLTRLILYHLKVKASRRIRKRRGCWVRSWIGRRRQFGINDQLMVELRNEDHSAFTNCLRMPPVMFDELLARVGPRLVKQYTF